MSRDSRLIVAVIAAGAVAVLIALASTHVPSFGGTWHPYRDAAVPAAVAHRTANVVSSVNFDQRGLDTLGEEMILLGSVVGASVLLRKAPRERRRRPREGRVLESTAMVGYLMLGATLLIGLDVVVHGHVSPGGGFQGGVILATAAHLLYVAGSYRAIQRLRPLALLEVVAVVGAISFAGLGMGGLIASRVVPRQLRRERQLRPTVVSRNCRIAQRRCWRGGGERCDRAPFRFPRAGPGHRRRRVSRMTGLAYGVAAWLLLIGCLGIARSRNLVHAVVRCLSPSRGPTFCLR